MIWIELGSLLTFGLGEPDEECVCVIDDADDPGDKNDKDVADDDLGAHWKPAGHSAFACVLLLFEVEPPFESLKYSNSKRITN